MKLNQINNQEKKKLFFFFISIVMTVLVIALLPRLSIPLTIAYVLYLIVNSVIPYLVKIGMKREVAAVTTFLVFIILSVLPLMILAPTIKNEFEHMGQYLPKVDDYIKTKYEQIQITIKDKAGYELNNDFVKDAMVYVTTAMQKVIMNIPKILASFLEWLLVIPFLFFFFLKDGPHFKKIILNLTPNLIFERFYNLTNQLNNKIGDYIFAKFVEASIVGVIIFIGLVVMDIRFAFMLAFVAAFTNIIPYVGPFLGFIPAIIVGLVEYGPHAPQISGIILLYVIANVIDMGFVFPILVSKMVNLHPIIVVVSVIIGSHYLGIVGMIVSIPLAAALKLIVAQLYQEIYGGNRSS